MKDTLPEESLRDIVQNLSQANEVFSCYYLGETGRRQPVHTVYGGAHLFKSDSPARLGALARRSLDQFAPNFVAFARALKLPGTNELPDSVDEAEDLLSRIEGSPEQMTSETKAVWCA